MIWKLHYIRHNILDPANFVTLIQTSRKLHSNIALVEQMFWPQSFNLIEFNSLEFNFHLPNCRNQNSSAFRMEMWLQGALRTFVQCHQ